MPTKVLSDMRLIMSGLLQDSVGKLSVTTRNQAINSAIKLHDVNIPSKRFHIVTGASEGLMRTPTGWMDEVSHILQIEYPLGDRPPIYLE